MKRFVLLFSLLIIISCEDKKAEKDTIAPTVIIVNPTTGLILSGTVNIEIEIKDDKELKSLSIKIGNESFVTDTSIIGKDSVKVSYELKTKTLSNNNHTMQVTITDVSNNMHTESVNFTVDNKSKWITWLPEEYRGFFFIEKSDGYIILVERKLNDYDSKYETYLLNENGELGELIDVHPDLLSSENNNQVPLYRNTGSGLYFYGKNKTIIKINNDGLFDLSYSISESNLDGMMANFDGENLIASKNGWIRLRQTDGECCAFDFYNLDDSEIKTKIFTGLSISSGNYQLIGALPDSVFILTDMTKTTSEDFRLIYIDLINPENSFVDSLSGLSPSVNYSPLLWIQNPTNRNQVSDNGYFIIYRDGPGALLMKYENNSFTHVATLETDNRFEKQYFIRENDIVMFGGDNDKIFRYSIGGASLETHNIRDAYGYYAEVNSVRTNIVISNDNGLIFSNVSYQWGHLIFKIDSNLNLAKGDKRSI